MPYSRHDDRAPHPPRLPRAREPARPSRAGRAAAGGRSPRSRPRSSPTSSASRRRSPRTRRSCASIRAPISRRSRRGSRTRASRRSTATPSSARTRSPRRGAAAGAVVAAVDMVIGGEVAERLLRRAPARPPCRDARRRWASATSATSSSARATRSRRHGLERVAIVDFDVHHGNGTQDLVWDDARILFASTHQMPLYPGTGAAERARRPRPDRQRAAAAGRPAAVVPRRHARPGAAGGRGASRPS